MISKELSPAFAKMLEALPPRRQEVYKILNKFNTEALYKEIDRVVDLMIEGDDSQGEYLNLLLDATHTNIRVIKMMQQIISSVKEIPIESTYSK